MILLHRKVLPRPGRPTRMMISFCRSTRLRFRTFRGACLWGWQAVSVLTLSVPLQGRQKESRSRNQDSGSRSGWLTLGPICSGQRR